MKRAKMFEMCELQCNSNLTIPETSCNVFTPPHNSSKAQTSKFSV